VGFQILLQLSFNLSRVFIEVLSPLEPKANSYSTTEMIRFSGGKRI